MHRRGVVMGALTLGPFVLSLDRAYAALGFAVLIVAAEIWARRRGESDVAAWAFTTTWVVFVAARLGFVGSNWGSFAGAPLTILAFWQGGFAPWWGIAAGAAASMWRARSSAAVRRAAPVVGVAATLAWLLPSGLLGAAPGGVDTALPAVTLTTLDGGSVALTEGRGPAIVNVWATWCPPCRRELPLLFAAGEANPDVHLWLVNQNESREVVERYLGSQNLPSRGVLLDGAGAIGDHFSIAGLPTTLAFDRYGTLVDLHVGEISAPTLARLVERARSDP